MEAVNSTFQQKCKICGSRNWSVLYEGPVRTGKFGEYSTADHVVWRCRSCQAGYLDVPPLNYESTKYRQRVDGGSTAEDFHRLHAGDQSEKLHIVGEETTKDKVIADIGCGAGTFLNLIAGQTRRTIAIEPMESYRDELTTNGHQWYPYCRDALKDWREKIDVATAFAVIEHVEHPLAFLKEINSLLKPGGELILSTPNYDDWLIGFLPEYARFFFRLVHLWYFNEEALRAIGTRAGFAHTDVRHFHRFDISNALLWVRDGRPTGKGSVSTLKDLNDAYLDLITRQGKTDYIYVWFRT